MDVETTAVGPSVKVPVVCSGEAAGSCCVFSHIHDRGIRPASACPQPRPNPMNQLVAEYLPRKNADESDPSADEAATSGGLNVFTPTV